jgi:hypothetical protein
LRTDHVAAHLRRGESVRNSRPDFYLCQHMWQKRLIDDQDLKELKSGYPSLLNPRDNLTPTNGRLKKDGRRRRQHVGQNTMSLPPWSQQFVGSALDPNDPSTISFMAGNDNLPQPFRGTYIYNPDLSPGSASTSASDQEC